MLGLLNTKSDLNQNLSKHFDVCVLDNVQVDKDLPDLNGLFIDWISDQDEFEFAHQAVIIENFIKKGIPTVLFDRHLTLSYKEFSWLNKFNITFLEPAINNRIGFEYFPFWTEPLKPFNYLIEDEPRKIDLAYQGDLFDKIESFERYYKEYARLYPKRKVVFQTKPDTLAHKIDEWSNHNLIQSEVDFKDVGFSIIIGSKKEYKIGYIPENLFEIMKNGCIPIFPRKHRFFGTTFDMISFDDLDYIITNWDKIRKVLIEDMFKNMLEVWPEMNISTAVERLKSWLI